MDLKPTRTENLNLVVFRTRRELGVASQDTNHADTALSGEVLPEIDPTNSGDMVFDHDAPDTQIDRHGPSQNELLTSLRDETLVVAVEGSVDAPTSELLLVKNNGPRYALVFDDSEQATALLGKETPTLGIQGYDLFGLLKGLNVGIAYNAADRQLARLLPGEAIDTYFETLDVVADETPPEEGVESEFKALLAPRHFPETLQTALIDLLAPHSARFDGAFLLKAEYANGKTGYLVAFSALDEADRGAITTAVSTALAKGKHTGIVLDIAVLARDDVSLARVIRVAERLDLKRSD